MITKKVVYIISGIDRAVAFEWIAEALHGKNLDFSFILLNNQTSYFQKYLESSNIPCAVIGYAGKKDIFIAFLKVLIALKRQKPDVVHTHFFDASLIGLLSAYLLRIKTRIYTRHYSTYHHEYFPKAVIYEKLMNRLATDIIAISENVRDVLINLEHVKEDKVKLIHHGYDLDAFKAVDNLRTNALNRKYVIPKDRFPVIGVVARYTHLKGIQYIIPAFRKILEDYPSALLILANANGDYQRQIKELLSALNSDQYLEVQFEQDAFALYKLFDLYLHVPINEKCEAFGHTYVEALAAGVPSIFTLSGVAPEFIIDRENALITKYCNSEDIYFKAKELLANKELRERLSKNGISAVRKMFDLKDMITTLENLYFLR